MKKIIDIIQPIPLIAILRGIKKEQVIPVADCLMEQGFSCMEIPLNTPDALDRIQELVNHCGDKILIGAGTVLTTENAQLVANTGAKLIVMPHCDTRIIAKAKQLNMYCLPGVVTPTEAFQAINAGADGLKLFPTDLVCPGAVSAMRAVLPKALPLFPTGGVSPEKMAVYLDAGANGFGFASTIFKPEYSLTEVKKYAELFVNSYKNYSHAA